MSALGFTRSKIGVCSPTFIGLFYIFDICVSIFDIVYLIYALIYLIYFCIYLIYLCICLIYLKYFSFKRVFGRRWGRKGVSPGDCERREGQFRSAPGPGGHFCSCSWGTKGVSPCQYWGLLDPRSVYIY